MSKSFWLVGAFFIAATPANAKVYRFEWKGNVGIVEGNAVGNSIKVGDPINASFRFDDSKTKNATFFPAPGGGTNALYDIQLEKYRFAVGSYLVKLPMYDATLVYRNNSFVQDFIIFLTHVDGAGPFGSTFANGQLIAQGSDNIIPAANITSGFPYKKFPTHRLFLGFGNGVTAKRIFGDLAVSVTTVPEPTSWAMMVVGFGLVGSGLRRQRNQPCHSSTAIAG